MKKKSSGPHAQCVRAQKECMKSSALLQERKRKKPENEWYSWENDVKWLGEKKNKPEPVKREEKNLQTQILTRPWEKTAGSCARDCRECNTGSQVSRRNGKAAKNFDVKLCATLLAVVVVVLADARQPRDLNYISALDVWKGTSASVVSDCSSAYWQHSGRRFGENRVWRSSAAPCPPQPNVQPPRALTGAVWSTSSAYRVVELVAASSISEETLVSTNCKSTVPATLVLAPKSCGTSPLHASGAPGRKVLMRGKSDDNYQELASSIDRSRKRHLEEGLLRGDQVRDRLRVQEASASPFLKRPRSSEKSPTPSLGMAMTLAEFRDYMENNTNKRLDGLDDKMSGMNTTIARIDETVKTNSTRIEAHEARIEEICAEVNKLKKGPDFPALPGTGTLAGSSPPTPVVDDKEFNLARRSLRLWPVLGVTEKELWDQAGIFLGTNLGMEGKIDGSSIECIARVEIPSGPGVRSEILVRFKDISTRDMVMGAAAKLAAFMDSEGRATAGMRMEVPGRLQQSFRVLFKYGQNLRARHVKFCDLERSLFLNVKLPGDENWSRVSLDVAMRGMKARRTIDDGQLERRLDITGPMTMGTRPRAGPPPPTQASAWMRRSGGSTSS